MATSGEYSSATPVQVSIKHGPKHRERSDWKERLKERCEQRVREDRQALLQSIRERHTSPMQVLREIMADENTASPSGLFASSLAQVSPGPLLPGDIEKLDLDLDEDERIELLCAMERALYEDEEEALAQEVLRREEEELAALVHDYEQYEYGAEEPSYSELRGTPDRHGGMSGSLRSTDIACPACGTAQLCSDTHGSVAACPNSDCPLHSGIPWSARAGAGPGTWAGGEKGHAPVNLHHGHPHVQGSLSRTYTSPHAGSSGL